MVVSRTGCRQLRGTQQPRQPPRYDIPDELNSLSIHGLVDRLRSHGPNHLLPSPHLSLQKKIDRLKARISKIELDKQGRENLKTVALGTSKINYMDPRITVAYCKRVDLPIEKIFNKSLLAKFAWAMEVEPEFRF